MVGISRQMAEFSERRLKGKDEKKSPWNSWNRDTCSIVFLAFSYSTVIFSC